MAALATLLEKIYRRHVTVAYSAFEIPWVLAHIRLLVDATGVTRRFPSAGGTVIRV
jgi:hypothetical protein